MINHKNTFESFISWVLEFTKVGKEIFQSKRIEIITIFLSNKTSIKLQNISYIKKCNVNLILLSLL